MPSSRCPWGGEAQQRAAVVGHPRPSPGMRERGWGRIVNIGSWSVREPGPILVLSNSHRSAALAAFKTIARDVAASEQTASSMQLGQAARSNAALYASEARPGRSGLTSARAGSRDSPRETQGRAPRGAG
jgi:3-oxoacyl-[acyl-carrier protein] reductase